MVTFFDELVSESAKQHAQKSALIFKQTKMTYEELENNVLNLACGLQSIGVERHDRVAVFLPKLPETIVSLFAISRANGVFVPVNSVLKGPQVRHILNDCDVKILITSSDRLKSLEPVLSNCPALQQVILTDKLPAFSIDGVSFSLLSDLPIQALKHVHRTDNDMAAILYTSGSTGRPKGVVLSHRNIVVGAISVAEYLENDQSDVLLALLPLSFDYGLSQITTGLLCGATVVLMDYFLAGDVVKAMAQHQVTGLAAVPPLWQQLMKAKWTTEATENLRYFTNSGGAMPQVTLTSIRATFPNAKPYLMYGLTEAFRSTYLDPALVDDKIGSMGKAIPNAEVMVVREDGTECDVDEPGELVHRGPHVSLGYWNDPAKTAERFKPVPAQLGGLVLQEMAVWSGDTVKRDDEGFLYFVGRKDEMIKTSGYRVSPMEVEEACYQGASDIAEAIASGVKDSELGQAITLLLVLKENAKHSEKEILAMCKKAMPNFMHPKYVEFRTSLPRNPNGKVDRSLLNKEVKEKYENV